MHRSRLLQVALSALVVGLSSSSAPAQTRWNPLNLFRDRVEADPNADYGLSEDNGPWMIMAATFSGEGGEAQARELVLELREQFHLPAYTYRMVFDFNEQPVVGRGVNRYGRPRQMRYRNRGRAHETAVLVGNYPSVDDPQAQRDLKEIKEICPQALDIELLAKQNKRTYQQLVGWRLSQWQAYKDNFDRLQSTAQSIFKKDNLGSVMARKWTPMGSAMLSRNPMLPKETITSPVVDDFVYQMNKDVPHSLLDCPGKYTVKVATFRGAMIVDQAKIRLLEEGRLEMKSRLQQAAAKAHRLTEALRLKGWEAYEFHSRGASMVTIGSFDRVGSPRGDGQIEINPQVHAIMQKFGADHTRGGQPRSFLEIPFDIQPMPVLVPRRALSDDYARARR